MIQPKRCAWANPNNPLYIAYHDNEWGKPSYDDAYLFEMLLLESFQAGLTWECVLNKREAFRAAFDGFDYHKIASYTQEKKDALAENKAIIRNRLKINAAVGNAAVFIKIQSVHRDGVIRPTTPLSDTISKDLQKRGMKFVGSTIIYAYLQAVGVVDDHEPHCDFGK